jgi:hypothetical protein
MTTISQARVPHEVVPDTVSVPGWVGSLLGRPVPAEGAGLSTLEGSGFALTTGLIHDAARLGSLDLQRAVCALYLDVAARLDELKARHAVRFWNFIPGIHARMGVRDGGILDRYMVFNAGRYAAYVRWHGQRDVGGQAATATGIGHSGADLVVHCLSSDKAGEPIENPRQVPAYRYSRRRGPMPPCFARATLIGRAQSRELLVGGTASVLGEQSVHLGDVKAQALETFANMAALVGGNGTTKSRWAALARYRTLRVYTVLGSDAAPVRELVAEHFPAVEALECVRADVCRRTLLVEIEGTAEGAGV